MTSPTSDAELLEALYRADKFLSGFENKRSGLLHVTSNNTALRIFYDAATALTYDKTPEDHWRRLRDRCTWDHSVLDLALKRLREVMILDDLAEL